MSRLVCWVCLLVISSLSVGCAATHKPSRPALINHIVLFMLENADTADELIADCDAQLAPLPGIASYFAGKHFDIGRNVAETDYDVCFFAGFMSQPDYEADLDHPTHLKLVTKWRPRLQWMRIYDTIDRTR